MGLTSRGDGPCCGSPWCSPWRCCSVSTYGGAERKDGDLRGAGIPAGMWSLAISPSPW